MIDIHNHVLIGVDDGPKDEREAVQLLEQAIAQGITDIIATPHHHSGSWKNPAEVVNHKIEDYTMQEEEVSDLKYISIEEMEDAIKNNDESYTFTKWNNIAEVISILKFKREYIK